MRTLDTIGFYTLTEKRARTATLTTPVQRAEFIITNKCNFKCPYCRGIDCKQLKYHDFVEQFGYVNAGRGLKNIRFSGGEPTIHPEIMKFIGFAKKWKCDHIAISTNGSADLGVYEIMIEKGVNDFSISLDACCAQFGEEMCGGIPGAWEKVVDNIKALSKLTYVTLGMVFTEETINTMPDVVKFGHDLGVADIRVISAAQSDRTLENLKLVDWNLLKDHPILRYRVMNTIEGRHVRGIGSTDCKSCGMVLDDTAVCDGYHYPCIIYMREHGDPIGKVGKDMWHDRLDWWHNHDTSKDPICSKNCLDVCIDYNNRWDQY